MQAARNLLATEVDFRKWIHAHLVTFNCELRNSTLANVESDAHLLHPPTLGMHVAVLQNCKSLVALYIQLVSKLLKSRRTI